VKIFVRAQGFFEKFAKELSIRKILGFPSADTQQPKKEPTAQSMKST